MGLDGDLICNFKKCRKHLNTYAWVTSCSHIFCDEDGTKEFSKTYTCPACETTLAGKFDIVRIDLQPTEQYKSMVLAGQKPETIMEICTRALAFWTYQAHQERTYQEYVATKARERAVQMEQYYEQIVARTQSELSSLKTQLSASKKELESTKKKYNEVSEKMSEKTRQHQKLQSLYDSMRRKCITPSTFEGSGDASSCRSSELRNFCMPLTSGDEFLRKPSSSSSRSASPPQRDFVLHPNNTPLAGIASSSNTQHQVQTRFSMGFATPR